MRELESVARDETGDRVAVIRPVVLGLAQAINHDDARRQRAAARLYIPSGYMAQSVFINNGSIWRELFE